MVFRRNAVCKSCGHAWYASFPHGTDETILECPRCRAQNSETTEVVLKQQSNTTPSSD